MRRLLISSAPARLDIKQAILDHFRNTGLFEAYGSTEAGWVTVLRPEEQFDKLGSIGRECPGRTRSGSSTSDGAPVPPGEVGELYFDTPATFQGYWNLPEQDRRPPSATAGARWATWPGATPTATTTSPTGGRT